MINLPEKFVKNILGVYKDQGEAWLKNLPVLLQKIEKHWDIKLSPGFNNLSYNYVAPGILDQKPIVVKCGFPTEEFKAEVAALKHFNGLGAVKLIDVNFDLGAILLEKITPGVSLEEAKITDEEAIKISADLLNKLHKPLLSRQNNFATLHDWFAGFKKLYEKFAGKTGPFPEELVSCADVLSQELLSSMQQQGLLHADLHYGNILFSEEHGWLAIDPKGIIGEREFEIPMPCLKDSVDKKLLFNRTNYFIEITGFDKQRIFNWLFVKCVLAAWWSFEDSGEIYQPYLRCAEILRRGF